MARFDSKHVLLEQLEDGWMLNHDQLEEPQALLQQALGSPRP